MERIVIILVVPLHIDTTNTSDRIKKVFTGKNYPVTTQAVVRGLDNAFPIITKKGHKKDEFFDDTDGDVNAYLKLIERDIEEIKEAVEQAS